MCAFGSTFPHLRFSYTKSCANIQTWLIALRITTKYPRLSSLVGFPQEVVKPCHLQTGPAPQSHSSSLHQHRHWEHRSRWPGRRRRRHRQTLRAGRPGCCFQKVPLRPEIPPARAFQQGLRDLTSQRPVLSEQMPARCHRSRYPTSSRRCSGLAEAEHCQ